jgi:hypothetical protein
MSEAELDRSRYPTRKLRLGEDYTDESVRDLSPGERMSMVWQLTLQTWAFKEDLQSEPRLRRDVSRVIRGRR